MRVDHASDLTIGTAQHLGSRRERHCLLMRRIGVATRYDKLAAWFQAVLTITSSASGLNSCTKPALAEVRVQVLLHRAEERIRDVRGKGGAVAPRHLC
jgi:hypothetical protein